VIEEVAGGVARPGIKAVSPFADGTADVLGDADGGRAPPLHDPGWITFLVGPDAVRIRFFPRGEERLQSGRVQPVSHQILTSTVMLVSQPKTSTTLTQAV